MWSDNETTEDLLGFKVHADLLIDVIKDDNILPISIGVFGDWGSGKSSILKIIKEQFEQKENDEYIDKETLCIYFNGWTFEGYDDAKAALLEAIVKELVDNKKIGNQIKDAITDKANKVKKSINWMRGAGMILKNVALPAVSAYFTGGLSLIPFLQQKIEYLGNKPEDIMKLLQSDEGKELIASFIKENQDNNTTNSTVADFKKDFEELLDKTDFKRLVVIIDDLDRCTPERIIENLEAVKLFLNVPKTAFVIGADPRIVRHAIEFKYKTDKIAYSTDEQIRNDRIISDYLEKLIQLPYNLPKLSDNEVETYLTLLLCKKSFNNKFSQILQKYQDHISKDRHSVFGFGNIKELLNETESKKIGQNISILASSSKIITSGLKGNPRQIKRFLNTYILRERLIQIAKFDHIKMDVLAKIMVLEYSNIDLFRELYNWQVKSKTKGEPKEIIELESLASEYKKEDISKKFSINWSKDEVINWLNSEPKLSKIDLRDYYWVSRDQLSDSISASSMLSKEIRDLRSKILNYSADTELHHLIENKVKELEETDLRTLLGLFEKKILQEANQVKIHEIFIAFMEKRVLFSLEIYLKVIKHIDVALIPGHLSSSLKISLQSNPEIQLVIDELNKDKNKETRIYKSLNA